MIAIIDSGDANISSLSIALDRLDVTSALTTDIDIIQSAERVILPGVGAEKAVMSNLKSSYY